MIHSCSDFGRKPRQTHLRDDLGLEDLVGAGIHMNADVQSMLQLLGTTRLRHPHVPVSKKETVSEIISYFDLICTARARDPSVPVSKKETVSEITTRNFKGSRNVFGIGRVDIFPEAQTELAALSAVLV